MGRIIGYIVFFFFIILRLDVADGFLSSLNMELANDVPAKRRFVNEILDDKSISMYKPYENFQVKKIINENSRCKTLCVYGHFEQSNSDAQNVAVQDSAVIILEKLPFSENEVKQILREAAARTVLENDIYSTFELKRECCEFGMYYDYTALN